MQLDVKGCLNSVRKRKQLLLLTTVYESWLKDQIELKI